ncbi:hypothetical protein ACA910_014763 [Epithemia clementina (nom. ined.)]
MNSPLSVILFFFYAAPANFGIANTVAMSVDATQETEGTNQEAPRPSPRYLRVPFIDRNDSPVSSPWPTVISSVAGSTDFPSLIPSTAPSDMPSDVPSFSSSFSDEPAFFNEFELGIPCGPNGIRCFDGQVCCNESCGICTEPDQPCIQLYCF